MTLELLGRSPNIAHKKYKVDSRIKIGSGGDICLNSETVSFHHAMIVKRKDGNFYLVDTYSNSGTYINDEKLSPNVPKVIKPGDFVRFGDFVFETSILYPAHLIQKKTVVPELKDFSEPEVKVDLDSFDSNVPLSLRLSASFLDLSVSALLLAWLVSSITSFLIFILPILALYRGLSRIFFQQTAGEYLFGIRMEALYHSKIPLSAIGKYESLTCLLNIPFGTGIFLSMQGRSFAQNIAKVHFVFQKTLSKKELFKRYAVLSVLVVIPCSLSSYIFLSDERIQMPLTNIPSNVVFQRSFLEVPMFDLTLPLITDIKTAPVVIIPYRKGPPEKYLSQIGLEIPGQFSMSFRGRKDIVYEKNLPKSDNHNFASIFSYTSFPFSLLITDQIDTLKILKFKKKYLTNPNYSVSSVEYTQNERGTPIGIINWKNANQNMKEFIFWKDNKEIRVQFEYELENELLETQWRYILARAAWAGSAKDRTELIDSILKSFQASGLEHLYKSQALLLSRLSVRPQDLDTYFVLASVNAFSMGKISKKLDQRFQENITNIYRYMKDVDSQNAKTKSIGKLIQSTDN